MKLLLTAASAALLLTGSALAQSSTSPGMSPNPPEKTEKATGAPSTDTSAKGSSAYGGTASASSTEITGHLKKLDKSDRSLTISTPTGTDRNVKVAETATIMRDGSTAALDQLKEGDDVRASFDPATNQATSLDVTSKGKSNKSDSMPQKSDSMPQK